MSLQFPPQLSERALRELFARRDKGDPNAVRAIVEGNLRLVQLISNKFKCDPQEVFQEGAFGLHKAALRFDPARGFRFSTYAGRIIEGSIRHHLAKEHKAPAPSELAGYEPVDDGPSAQELAELREGSESLRRALDGLSYEQRRVLELRFGLYGEPESLRQVAATFGCSPTKVKRIEREALALCLTSNEALLSSRAPAAQGTFLPPEPPELVICRVAERITPKRPR